MNYDSASCWGDSWWCYWNKRYHNYGDIDNSVGFGATGFFPKRNSGFDCKSHPRKTAPVICHSDAARSANVTSAARIAANRANARKSTGPKTVAGKAMVSRNARRHGLSRPLFCEGAFTPHVEALAREIAGQDASGECLALACDIAAAQLDLARIRIAKRDLQDAANFGSTDAQYPCDWSALSRLERLDHYEQRVFTRRRRAIREFCKTKPLDGSAIELAAAVPVTQGAAADFCRTKPMPEVVPLETSAPEASKGIAHVFCKTKPILVAEGTLNNNCCVSVGASVRSSAFTRPLSADGKEGRPRRSRRKGGTANNAGRSTSSRCPESSASVLGENVSDNSCKTKPTDHLGVKPTPLRKEVTVERFCKTKPSDANVAQWGCPSQTRSNRAKQFLQNKANGWRCKEYKTVFDGMRAARFDAFQPNRACQQNRIWVISQNGPAFIRGP
jgi:hypothetical protein